MLQDMSFQFNSHICRLCLNDKGSAIHLYETNEQYGFVVVNILNELLELEITPSDGLPSCICSDCLDEAARFKHFKTVSHESKRQLKNVIMQNNNAVVPESLPPSRRVLQQPMEEEAMAHPGDDGLADTSAACLGRLWSQKLLDMMDNQTVALANNRQQYVPSAQDYLENLPEGYTSLVDSDGCRTVEPFEAVDCVVGAFGYEMEGRPIRSIGSSCMQHPALVEGGRGIKLEEETTLNGEAFLASLASEYKHRHRCSICSKLFTDFPSLRDHLESKVCDIPMPCKLCPKTFFGKRRLQKHVYNCHRSDSAFQCCVCAKKFSKKDHLNRHMSTHTTERPYACPSCHRRYKGERQLECHMYTFHEIRKRENYPCKLCGKLFVRRETLDSHVCAEPRTFVCHDCGLSYGTKHELKQHIWRIHLNHLPHGCLTCGKEFATVSELNQHRVVHQVERPFPCAKCSSCFKTKRHLKQHSAMCLSERKVRACYVCGDAFATEDDLTQHKRMHSREEEGRHPCALCENTYKKSSYLKQHVRRCHVEEKSFACAVCAKTFAVKSDLRQHSMVHSEMRPYACEECGKCYKHKQALQRHVTTTHVAERIAQGVYC